MDAIRLTAEIVSNSILLYVETNLYDVYDLYYVIILLRRELFARSLKCDKFFFFGSFSKSRKRRHAGILGRLNMYYAMRFNYIIQ